MPGRERVGEVPGEAGLDLASLRLDVYESRDGWWNPEHDVVVPPQGWEFLATGQAFVTRSVKATGVFWLAWAPRSRTRQHRRLLGLWAPAAAIRRAQRSEAATASARAVRREAAARSRARQEARYQDELAAAIVEYLHFAARHEALAQTIARSAAERWSAPMLRVWQRSAGTRQWLQRARPGSGPPAAPGCEPRLHASLPALRRWLPRTAAPSEWQPRVPTTPASDDAAASDYEVPRPARTHRWL